MQWDAMGRCEVRVGQKAKTAKGEQCATSARVAEREKMSHDGLARPT
jgi:hypothetical protein